MKRKPLHHRMRYFRSTVLLVLGIFILLFSGHSFNMTGVQRYGLGSALLLYSLYRLWKQNITGRKNTPATFRKQ